MGKSTKNHFFSINFIGSAGGGKSTLIPLVESILNKKTRNQNICKTAARSELKVFTASVLHPSVFRCARAITKNMKAKHGRRLESLDWIRWVRRLGLQAWHADGLLSSSKTDIWLFDEGIVHYLRKTKGPLPMDLLKSCPLPHMVVNIHVDKIQAAWRRVLRTNHNIRYEILDHPTCRLLAEKRCPEFILQRGVNETRVFLQKWSARFCREPLSDAEIAEIIQEAEQKVFAANKSNSAPQINWLRPALEILGVAWIDIDTSDGNPPEKTAGLIAEQIWQQYWLACQAAEKSAASSGSEVK